MPRTSRHVPHRTNAALPNYITTIRRVLKHRKFLELARHHPSFSPSPWQLPLNATRSSKCTPPDQCSPSKLHVMDSSTTTIHTLIAKFYGAYSTSSLPSPSPWQLPLNGTTNSKVLPIAASCDSQETPRNVPHQTHATLQNYITCSRQ